MGKKMYYTEAEAAERLGVGTEDLANYVRDSQLRIFQDGSRKMFRVDEVDKLAGGGAEEIDLAPGGGADEVSLAEAELTAPPTKEDTVITAEGISIFDDEDLEIDAADPMAKTQIAPSIEDQVALEGVGSGSGLLDLTRESDDTSLGAEVLDHIDMEGEAAGAPVVAGAAASAAGMVQPGVEPPLVTSYVESVDAAAGLFGGIIIGCSLVAGLLAVVALSAFGTERLSYIEQLKANMTIVVAAGFLAILVAGVLGWLMGKASAARQAAMRQMGA